MQLSWVLPLVLGTKSEPTPISLMSAAENLMKYALDTEFIDTPTCSALISLALVAEDGRELYLEFQYPEHEISPWLRANVVPMLGKEKTTFEVAAAAIQEFCNASLYGVPEFWAYYGSYDWYWFCRIHGGFMEMPQNWPHLVRDFAFIQQGVPAIAGPEHFALNDARALIAAMRKRDLL